MPLQRVRKEGNLLGHPWRESPSCTRCGPGLGISHQITWACGRITASRWQTARYHKDSFHTASADVDLVLFTDTTAILPSNRRWWRWLELFTLVVSVVGILAVEIMDVDVVVFVVICFADSTFSTSSSAYISMSNRLRVFIL